jgi:spoIIIJ-associated protein
MELDYKQEMIKMLELVAGSLVSGLIIEVVREGDQWRVNINSDENSVLVGEKGENIRSIQHIVRVYMHRKFPEDRTHFMIDVGGFRKNREHLIKSKISILAREEVIGKGIQVILMNFNGYERKLVHDILADVDGLETTSIGEDEKRKLIIRPTSEIGYQGLDKARILDIKDLESIEESEPEN